MKMPVVVGIGEILWDMLPTGRQLGGAPANFACFARALGAEAYIVSRVGGDRLGGEILKKLDEKGFSLKYITRDQSHPTGSVEVRLKRNGKPGYDIKENVAWDFIEFSSALRSLAGKTKAVCFGSLSQRSPVTGETIREFVAAMSVSSLKVFDINLRQSFYSLKIIHELLTLSNICKLNDEELHVVSGLFSIRGGEKEAVEHLIRNYRLRLVAVTRGSKGAVLYCRKGVYSARGRKARVVDTVGAGDAFTAALVMGLLKGLKMETISNLANRLAAYVCSQQGATPILSPDPETTNIMKALRQPFNGE